MLLDAQILTVMVYLPTSIFVRIVHSDGQSMRMGAQSTRNQYNGPQAQVFQDRWILFLHSPSPHRWDLHIPKQMDWQRCISLHVQVYGWKWKLNSGTWSTNPERLFETYPRTHLFYGSFDSSYHNDVLSRKSDVEARLNPSEEEQWDGRIHYIDMDASNIQADWAR